MALLVGDADRLGADEWIDNWPIPKKPTFIVSDDFELLKRELGRYVRDRATGRSFLIAGHRGAGKTTLANNAIEDLGRDVLREAWKVARDRREAGKVWEGPRQRPLLVRLHGPSLLATSTQGASNAGAPDMAGVLELVMVALYRALAEEAGRCMRSLANDRSREIGGRSIEAAGVVEAAAQFILDLDNAPKAALLRSYYERLGCLRQGIFWPLRVAEAIVQGGSPDQGMRELVALATAAQAFEICAGEVTSSNTETVSGARGKVTELKLDASLAELLNKALGIFAGLAVGMAANTAGAGILGAALSGIAVSVITVASYSHSTRKSTSKETKTDYKFIRNRTKQSLDRDLPGVVHRIRDAGLVPIFVVDELDKLMDPDAAIAGFIGGVKHLTTDFGAFCFLTDRSYYERVSRRVSSNPYPLEHTFFSHWLPVLHDTDDLLDYLAKTISSDLQATAQAVGRDTPPGTSTPAENPQASERAFDEHSRAVLALYLVHRSKLNAVDLFRELGRVRRRRDVVPASPDPVGASPRHRVAATFQLAVRAVLRQPPLRDRIAVEPQFSRMATDALYMPSRAWEAGRADVVLTREAIAAELLERAQPRGDEDGTIDVADPPKGGRPLQGPSEPDLDLLVEQVVTLTEFLSDLRSLVDAPETALGGSFVGDPARIVPLELTDALIEGADDGDRRFRFLFDAQGRDVRRRAALVPGAGLRETLRELPEWIEEVDAFEEELGKVGLSFGELVAAGILPPSMDQTGLQAARLRLRNALSGDRSYQGQADDIQLMMTAVAIIDRHLSSIGELLHLLVEVAVAARVSSDGALKAPLVAVGRYLDLPALFGRDHAAALQSAAPLAEIVGRPSPVRADLDPVGATDRIAMLRAIGASLIRHRAQLSEEVGSAGSASYPGRTPEVTWKRWAALFLTYAKGAGHLAQPPHFDDMASFAACLPPGTLFRRDLDDMTVAEWSRLYLRGFPSGEHALPSWVCVAGLWGLGFGRDLLDQAASFGSPDDTSIDLLRAFLADAPPGRIRGIILLMAEGASSIGESSERRPEEYGHPADSKIVAIHQHELGMYSRALSWLVEREALEGLVYEQ